MINHIVKSSPLNPQFKPKQRHRFRTYRRSRWIYRRGPFRARFSSSSLKIYFLPRPRDDDNDETFDDAHVELPIAPLPSLYPQSLPKGLGGMRAYAAACTWAGKTLRVRDAGSPPFKQLLRRRPIADKKPFKTWIYCGTSVGRLGQPAGTLSLAKPPGKFSFNTHSARTTRRVLIVLFLDEMHRFLSTTAFSSWTSHPLIVVEISSWDNSVTAVVVFVFFSLQ